MQLVSGKLLFVATAAVATAFAGAAAAARPPAQQQLLTLGDTVVVRTAPDPTAAPLRRVSAETPLTHARTVLPVIGSATGPSGGRWLRVRLPMRPNGATGWVPAYAGVLGATAWRIVVQRGARRAIVYEGARARARFSVVVGAPATPTPLGTFFVVEKLHLAPGVVEGPWALATSAYSTVLTDFDGGPGQVALHGTVGLDAPLGTAASHGCVRFGVRAITWLARRVGAGTPVIVSP